jgi:hypothetical protein
MARNVLATRRMTAAVTEARNWSLEDIVVEMPPLGIQRETERKASITM